jgi:GntR family transcriptional regulator
VHLWFARNGAISIRDQLITQLMLAMASGDLAAGKRLPSTRALAKRFQLHPNTVSAAYQQLQDLGWVESVRGSGVYVRAGHNQGAQLQALDRLVIDFLRGARFAGLTAGAAKARLDNWLAHPPRRFVFVHPDQQLRAIICHELRQTLAWEVLSEASAEPPDAVFLTLPSKYEEVRALVPPSTDVVPMQMRSVANSLAAYLPARPDVLMFIASGWPGFLEIARTVLTAAGYDPAAVLFRETSTDGWTRGFSAGSFVVCDALTAALVPECAHKIVFALVSEEAIAGLKTYERFHAG